MQSGWGLSNTGPFSSIQSNLTDSYWYGLEYALANTAAWHFDAHYGYQNVMDKVCENFAWAVRPGDVAPVPVPAAVGLFGSGLMGLVGVRWRKGRIRRLGDSDPSAL
ncbi:MAG: hypothetical protein ACFCUJ_15320 [Thiotrichales bacterium]